MSELIIKSWSTYVPAGIEIKGNSLCEPDQSCPSISQILAQFGVPPEYVDDSTYESEYDALSNQFNPLMDIDDVESARDYLSERERTLDAQRTNSPSQRSDANLSQGEDLTNEAQRNKEVMSQGADLPTSGTE